ncbi:MAG: isoaspartyl peptidase/L-asparaginase [Alphaproteobacteria bacterium]
MTFALAIHGGAGARPDTDYSLQEAHMAALIAQGGKMLESGASALDAVTAMVSDMESSGLYVAGKGSAPNTAGMIELDASVMTGPSRQAGAVSAVRDLVHPVEAARKVMTESGHVMLTGEAARKFAIEHGLEAIENPDAYYTEHTKHGSSLADINHGTVGAVALDIDGNLAAATSTGGVFNKRPGRVGDTPLIGAGTWADDLVAVSGTGLGEAFIRCSAAHDVAARMHYAGTPVYKAVCETLDEIRKCGGDGGIIAIDRNGTIAMPFNSDGMKRAAVSDTRPAVVRIFQPETG